MADATNREKRVNTHGPVTVIHYEKKCSEIPDEVEDDGSFDLEEMAENA